MSAPESWTVGRLLKWTTDYFKQRGCESPRLDAEVLLAHVRGCERIQLYTSFEEETSAELRESFRELVRRRADGTPVAYLVGHREFFSLSFEVTPDVLIPRPETEHLVTELLDRVKEVGRDQESLDIVDVGTGSGAIAVCVAKQLDRSHVTAVDISSAAIAVAARNAARHNVANRIEFVESDLFSRLPADRMFDFVVSNPPYITEDEFRGLPTDVRDREPRLALVAGPRGIDVIQRLVDQAAERLSPNGWLLFEISPMIESPVRDLVSARYEFERLQVAKDLAGHARVVQAQRRAQ